MQVLRKHLAPGSATNRSAVTNGSRLLDGIDGRSAAARRFRDLVQAFETEIGGEQPSELERGLIRQAAALALRAEQLQAAIVRGEAVDDDHLIRLSGEARRLVDVLKAKTATRKVAGNGQGPSDVGDLVA